MGGNDYGAYGGYSGLPPSSTRGEWEAGGGGAVGRLGEGEKDGEEKKKKKGWF